MSWNHREKIAVLRTLIQISIVDRDFAQAEELNLCKFTVDFDLSGSDVEEAKNMSDEEVVNIIRSFTPTEKEVVKTFWIKQIQADGKVANEEAELLIDMANACRIDISDLMG